MIILEQLSELTNTFIGPPGPPGRSIVGKPGPPGIQGPTGNVILLNVCRKEQNKLIYNFFRRAWITRLRNAR